MTYLNLIHFVLSASLFYAVFCRAVKMSFETKIEVRFVVWVFGIASCIGMALPFRPGWQADPFAVFLLAASVLAKFVFSVQWRDGVPAYFLRTHNKRPPLRVVEQKQA